jgi:predicted phage terminase large subunit-like protein
MSLESKLELLSLMEERERRKKAQSIISAVKGLSREKSVGIYNDVLIEKNDQAMRELCKHDLFFLLLKACARMDIDRDWLFDRCREVEASPNGHLDLWAREHYKSTIITFGKSIQDVLVDPDGTLIGIFSHTRPIAKGFLDQIKRELETNEFLKKLFPDVLYESPRVEAPRWSLDGGLIVKRKSNPKEATIEAWGLVDGQPTSKHFTILVYDDVVTRESVTTPEQIKKTTEAWELSLNLGAEGGAKRYIGTRYHANDTYKTMLDRGSVIKRIYPATDNGEIDGNPVLLSIESLQEKRRDMGPYTYGSQMLQNPTADKAMGFKEEWLRFYDDLGDTRKWNKYILVDPASEKKKTSDFTTIAVIGLAPDNNYYLLSAIRDRMNLTERTEKLFEFHREFEPISVGYEKYGMQSDIEHIKYVMERKNYRFEVVALGGSVAKVDRIRGLVPVFEQGRFYLPKKHTFITQEGKNVDFVRVFIDEEYAAFPVSVHDDMLDCIARIVDQGFETEFPKLSKPNEMRKSIGRSGHSNSWMG